MQTRPALPVDTVTSDQPSPPQQPLVSLTAGQPSSSDIIPSSSQLTGDQDQVQSNVEQPRPPIRATSVASTLSRTSSTTPHPPVYFFQNISTHLSHISHQAAQPLAFKFFDPSVDMEVTARPVDPTDMPAGTNPNEIFHGSTSTPNTQYHPPAQPFVGLGSYEVGRASSSRGLPEAGEPSPLHNTSSSVEKASGPKAAGSTPPYQGSFRTRVRRRSSLPWPSTNPTDSQVSGIATTSVTTIRRRNDSLGEIEAQRGNIPVQLHLSTNS